MNRGCPGTEENWQILLGSDSLAKAVETSYQRLSEGWAGDRRWRWLLDWWRNVQNAPDFSLENLVIENDAEDIIGPSHEKSQFILGRDSYRKYGNLAMVLNATNSFDGFLDEIVTGFGNDSGQQVLRGHDYQVVVFAGAANSKIVEPPGSKAMDYRLVVADVANGNLDNIIEPPVRIAQQHMDGLHDWH